MSIAMEGSPIHVQLENADVARMIHVCIQNFVPLGNAKVINRLIFVEYSYLNLITKNQFKSKLLCQFQMLALIVTFLLVSPMDHVKFIILKLNIVPF